MKKMKRNSNRVGNSGEYYVSAELERRGFTVALPMANTKMFDMIAIDEKTNQKIAIQVKTNSRNARSWTLRNNNIRSDVLYFFVSFDISNSESTPNYYIVSGKEVIDYLNNSQEQKGWKTDMRRFKVDKKYKGNWQVISKLLDKNE